MIGLDELPAVRLGAVDLLVLDFDGVLTDNGVWVDSEGRESVRCDRSDGLGLAAVRGTGLPVLVLSTETNPVVSARCRGVFRSRRPRQSWPVVLIPRSAATIRLAPWPA